MRLNYAIVFARDMRRSVSCYRDVLGLPLKFDAPGWTDFATDGATLTLHLTARPDAEGSAAHAERAGTCRPRLRVPDLDEFHERMVAGKVPCLQVPTEICGALVAQYADPDGLARSVGEERRTR